MNQVSLNVVVLVLAIGLNGTSRCRRVLLPMREPGVKSLFKISPANKETREKMVNWMRIRMYTCQVCGNKVAQITISSTVRFVAKKFINRQKDTPNQSPCFSLHPMAFTRLGEPWQE